MLLDVNNVGSGGHIAARQSPEYRRPLGISPLLLLLLLLPLD